MISTLRSRLIRVVGMICAVSAIGADTALGASVPSRPATAAVPDFGASDAYVEAQRGALRVPGLALGVVAGDGVMHAAGFGHADDAGRAVTADTPFVLGSTSKSFTALAVMQLVEAGRIELTAPVQRCLPWFRVADETGMSARSMARARSGMEATRSRSNRSWCCSPIQAEASCC